MTRNGAPFHGAIGAGSTVTPAASSQLPDGLCARASTAEKSETEKAPAISNDAVTAEDHRRAGNKKAPVLERPASPQ